MRTQKFTPEQVAEALKATGGLAALAAEKLGCTAHTVTNYAARYASVRDVLAHQKEKRLDIAEGQLWRLVQDGNIGAIIFFLKTQGRNRGFTERHEVTGADGKPIEVRQTHDVDPEFFASVFVVLGAVNATPGTQEADQSATPASTE